MTAVEILRKIPNLTEVDIKRHLEEGVEIHTSYDEMIEYHWDMFESDDFNNNFIDKLFNQHIVEKVVLDNGNTCYVSFNC